MNALLYFIVEVWLYFILEILFAVYGKTVQDEAKTLEGLSKLVASRVR